MGQSVNEVRGQLDGTHFLLGGPEVIFYAVEFDTVPVFVPDGKTRAYVAVTRLTDGARIHEQFLTRLAFDGDELVEFITCRERTRGLAIRHEHHRKMAVAEEGYPFGGQ